MNDRKKSLVIAGLLVCLTAVALHFLLAQQIKNDLDNTGAGFVLDTLEDAAQPDSAAINPDAVAETEIVRLEKRLHTTNVVKYLLLFIGLAALVAGYVLRAKKTGDDFDDEWEEEEWEEEADEKS